MADNIGEQLADRFTEHAVDLERFQASIRSKVVDMLKTLEARLVYDLVSIDPTGTPRFSVKQARLDTLIKQTRNTIITAYKDVKDLVRSQLIQYAPIESDFIMSAINQIAGVELMSTAVTAEKLRVLATDIMIQGAPSREWWSRIASDSQTKFLDTIRQGMLKGDETQKITKALRENVFPVTQRNANALVRTSIQTVNASVRLATFQANDDVVKLIQQRSTLDRRTTQICMAYSGKVWTNDDKHDPVGHDLPFVNEPDGSPDGIPRHWNCRSIFLPIVRSWEELGAAGIKTGGRPSGKPDQYFRTRLAAKGLTDEQIEDVITNAQASMDGAVPKDWDYETWLKTKSVDFQKDVLGEGKWNLWQKGKITFSDLVDQTGNPLTLEQLLEKIKN